MERITREDLDTRAANLNRRIEGTGHFVVVEGRNGYFGLDEYEFGAERFAPNGTTASGAAIRTITVGTKREVADFLHAMMVGIDLSRVVSESKSDYTGPSFSDAS